MGFRWFSMAFGMLWVRFAFGFMGFARVAKVESLVEKTVSSRSSRKYLGGFDLDHMRRPSGSKAATVAKEA